MAKAWDLMQFWVTTKYFSSASFICCDSWVSYKGVAEELSLLKCYAVSIAKQLSTFRRTVVASSSGWSSPRRSRCIVCGATAQIGPRQPHCWGWSITIRRTHTHPVRMLWTSDQQVAEAATYTTHKKHRRRTSVPSVEFETVVPEIKRPHTYASDARLYGCISLPLMSASINPKFTSSNQHSHRSILRVHSTFFR